MVLTGLQNLLSDIKKYQNRNIALIANHTSLGPDLVYSWDLLIKNGLNIKAVFSPEHGLFGTEQDQIPVTIQPKFDFKIFSLYGASSETLSPEISFLKDIDLVIFDIQDIGARYYTYINTMVLFMKAIDGMDIEFIVLDRPNPLGGEGVEGPVLDMKYESFVGVMPVTVRHGLTACEFASMAIQKFSLDVNLSVIKMKGWKRDMLYGDTGLTWVPPSPNMPTISTAIIYPGLCLMEGLNISEGRGTTTPFEMIGAPFIDSYEFADLLNSLKIQGVYFRPMFFNPTFNKYSGQITGGVHIHVTDNESFLPFKTGIAIVWALHKSYEEMEFLSDVYEFNDTYPAFDLLTGSSKIREMILADESLEKICQSWKKEEDDFREYKQEFHIY